MSLRRLGLAARGGRGATCLLPVAGLRCAGEGLARRMFWLLGLGCDFGDIRVGVLRVVGRLVRLGLMDLRRLLGLMDLRPLLDLGVTRRCGVARRAGDALRLVPIAERLVGLDVRLEPVLGLADRRGANDLFGEALLLEERALDRALDRGAARRTLWPPWLRRWAKACELPPKEKISVRTTSHLVAWVREASMCDPPQGCIRLWANNPAIDSSAEPADRPRRPDLLNIYHIINKSQLLTNNRI